MKKNLNVFTLLCLLGLSFATDTARAQNETEQLPPIQLWIYDCARWADKMMIFYAVQNNMDQDINSFTLYTNDIPGQHDCMALFDDGTKSYMHWNTYLRSNPTVPAHSRRIGAILTEDPCPATAKTANITLGGRCSDGPIVTKQNPYGEFVMQYPEVPIRDYLPSNRDGVYCTNPNFLLTVDQVRRDGDRIFVNFSITSPEPDDVLFFFPAYQAAQATLADGSQCKVDLSRQKIPLSKDQPVQAMATIYGVPQTADEIANLTVRLESNEYPLYSNFRCIFRNLKID